MPRDRTSDFKRLLEEKQNATPVARVRPSGDVQRPEDTFGKEYVAEAYNIVRVF
jgi:hypothetical protein